MDRPLIAVTSAIESIPTGFGVELDCTKLASAYTNAIYNAGGQPVVMPVTEDPPTHLLAKMDGVLLTGGADIDPHLYGEQPIPGVYGVDRRRDNFETQIYREAIASGMPVLALCRGMQLVNILRGGTLFQQLEDGLDHWQKSEPWTTSHDIDIDPTSALAKSLACHGALSVNSYHHQGLKTIGSDLKVVAVCGDVVEGMEAEDADLIAVQWHPEHLTNVAPAHKSLFENFIKRASSFSSIRTPGGS